jgi:hypothetical protein
VLGWVLASGWCLDRHVWTHTADRHPDRVWWTVRVTSRKPKRQPPSRARYQSDHPTIGVHVDLATHAKLIELRERSGLSFGQLVRRALGVVEHDVEAAYEAAYSLGWADGEREGWSQAVLNFPCSVCGQPVEVRAGSEIARAAAAHLVERGWVHGGRCYAQRYGPRPA